MVVQIKTALKVPRTNWTKPRIFVSTYRNVEESLRLTGVLWIWRSSKDSYRPRRLGIRYGYFIWETIPRIKRTLLDLLNTENELFENIKGYFRCQVWRQYAKYRVMNAAEIYLLALRVEIPEEWNERWNINEAKQTQFIRFASWLYLPCFSWQQWRWIWVSCASACHSNLRSTRWRQRRRNQCAWFVCRYARLVRNR